MVIIDKSNLKNLKLTERNYIEYKDYEEKYISIRLEYEKRITKDGMNIKCEKSRIKSEIARLNTPVINWVLSLIAVVSAILLSLTASLISVKFDETGFKYAAYIFIGASILISLIIIWAIIKIFKNYIKMRIMGNSGFDDDIVFYNTCLCVLEDLEDGEEKKVLEKARQESAVTLKNKRKTKRTIIKIISKLIKAFK